MREINNKKCTRCKRVKNVDNFQKQGKYYSSRCKLCLNKVRKLYVKNNKGKVILTRKKF